MKLKNRPFLVTVSFGDTEGCDLSRVATLVKQVRAKYPNIPVKVSIPGDIFLGRISARVTARMLKKMGVDWVALGNRDPYKTVKGLSSYLMQGKKKLPILTANLRLKKGDLPDCFQDSADFTANGQEVLVVGLANPDLQTYGVMEKQLFVIQDPAQVSKAIVSESIPPGELSPYRVLLFAYHGGDDDAPKRFKDFMASFPGQKFLIRILGGHDHKTHKIPIRIDEGIDYKELDIMVNQ